MWAFAVFVVYDYVVVKGRSNKCKSQQNMNKPEQNDHTRHKRQDTSTEQKTTLSILIKNYFVLLHLFSRTDPSPCW